ncbi:MAG TPA: TolC family protein [Cyclobacteriaceae bacterium]|nr:TolC family protein [Cyclobacteriaceae bacterium]
MKFFHTSNHFWSALLLTLFICFATQAQRLSLDQAVQAALKNNLAIKSAEQQVEYFRQLKKTGSDIGKLSVMWMHGQYNSLYQDNNLTLSQTIPFPTTLSNQTQLGKEQVIGAQQNLVVQHNNLAFEVKSTYYQLLLQDALKKLLLSQDSLYSDFANASNLRYKTGESNLLEKTTAETQLMDSRNQQRQNEADLKISSARLQALLKSENPIEASDDFVKRTIPLELDSGLHQNPSLKFMKQEVIISQQLKRVERSKVMPDLLVGGFVQSLTGVQNVNGQDVFFPRTRQFTGFEVGLAIPLWIKPNLARAKAASFQEEVFRKNAQHFETMLTGDFRQALQDLDKNQSNIAYFETSALQNANLLLSQAKKAFRGGEIGYIEYLQALKNSIGIRSNYLHAIYQYNLSIIKLEFLLGKI